MKLPDAFSPEVVAELARPARLVDPRVAEIVPDVEPAWYVLEVFNDRQRDVADDLAARRFGIFVPESEETVVVRGRKVKRRVRMFPGYVFVFVWDITAHWEKLKAVTGVVRNMGKISFKEIDEIRAVENTERPLPGASKKKRRHNRKRGYDDEVVAVYPWSAFQDRLLRLDSEGRNQTLRKALGLSS